MSREQIVADIIAALSRVDATQLTYIYKILLRMCGKGSGKEGNQW